MVIGLSGKIRSGKSRVAKIFKKVLEKEGKTCEIKSFASPIYEIVSELYRTDVEQVKKDKRDNLIVLMNNNRYNGGAGSDFFASSYREILQKIGTTARDRADEDIWVNALFGYDNEKVKGDFTWTSDYWIIDDVRFPNEAKRILECNGKLIRINRPDAEDNEHIIENSLNDWQDWDLVIENNISKKKKRKKELTKIVKEFLGVQNGNGN